MTHKSKCKESILWFQGKDWNLGGRLLVEFKFPYHFIDNGRRPMGFNPLSFNESNGYTMALSSPVT